MPFPLLLKKIIIQDQSITLFEPEMATVMNSYNTGQITFPYWSKVWPAAIGLARFLIHHPCYIRGKKVVELAAGLGLPAVVATQHATFVIASDYMDEAVTAMQQTVAYNHLQNMQVQLLDWYTLPADLTTDILLLSDVSYDTTLFAVQEKVITKFLQQGTTVIISTPQRLMAKEAIMPLLSFCRHREELVVTQNGATVMISIMVLYNNEISLG